MNMFLAFGMRAAFSLMKTMFLVNDLGFSSDVNQTQMDVTFVETGNVSLSRLLEVMFSNVFFVATNFRFNW